MINGQLLQRWNRYANIYLDCCSFIILISFDVFQFPYRDARTLWRGIVDSKPPDNTENQTQSSTNVEYTQPSSIKPLPLTEVTSNTKSECLCNKNDHEYRDPNYLMIFPHVFGQKTKHSKPYRVQEVWRTSLGLVSSIKYILINCLISTNPRK